MSKQRSRTSFPEIHIKELLIFKSLPLLNIQNNLNYVGFFCHCYIFSLEDAGPLQGLRESSVTEFSQTSAEVAGLPFLRWLGASGNLGLISCLRCNLRCFFLPKFEMKEVQMWLHRLLNH